MIMPNINKNYIFALNYLTNITMKKALFSAALIAAASFSMSAQDIKYGVKAGVNFTNYSGDVSGTDMRTGFHVGGLAEFKWGNFAVQPELLYSTAGAKADSFDPDTFQTVEATDKLGYISIPVAAKYFIIEGLSIQAGPQFAFLVSAKAEVGNEEGDIKDLYKSFDLGVFGGLGYEMESGLLFSARYIQGVSNISDINFEGYSDAKVNNTNIQISVGYKF